jgi:hypothetical protein
MLLGTFRLLTIKKSRVFVSQQNMNLVSYRLAKTPRFESQYIHSRGYKNKAEENITSTYPYIHTHKLPTNYNVLTSLPLILAVTNAPAAETAPDDHDPMLHNTPINLNPIHKERRIRRRDDSIISSRMKRGFGEEVRIVAVHVRRVG